MRSTLGKSDSGSASVEFALALPAVIVMLSLILGTFGYALAQHQNLAAARYAARMLSLGDDSMQVASSVKEHFGPGYDIRVYRSPPVLMVQVHSRFGWQQIGLPLESSIQVYDDSSVR